MFTRREVHPRSLAAAATAWERARAFGSRLCSAKSLSARVTHCIATTSFPQSHRHNEIATKLLWLPHQGSYPDACVAIDFPLSCETRTDPNFRFRAFPTGEFL